MTKSTTVIVGEAIMEGVKVFSSIMLTSVAILVVKAAKDPNFLNNNNNNKKKRKK